MLTPEKKQKCLDCCQLLLDRFREEGGEFLLRIIAGDESWNRHFDPEEKKIQNCAINQEDSSDCHLELARHSLKRSSSR